jgi:hypothetical protein
LPFFSAGGFRRSLSQRKLTGVLYLEPPGSNVIGSGGSSLREFTASATR